MRGVSYRSIVSAGAVVSMALVLAAGATAADGAARPDDRATHGPGAIAAAQRNDVVRPDDRADRQLPATVLVTPTLRGDGFDWKDAGIGALATAGVVLVLAGAAVTGLRRRPQPAYGDPLS